MSHIMQKTHQVLTVSAIIAWKEVSLQVWTQSSFWLKYEKESGWIPEKIPGFTWEVNTMDIIVSSPVFSPRIPNVSEKSKNISRGKKLLEFWLISAPLPLPETFYLSICMSAILQPASITCLLLCCGEWLPHPSWDRSSSRWSLSAWLALGSFTSDSSSVMPAHKVT